MHHAVIRVAAIAALGLLAGSAAANDGVMEREAGGLVFRPTDQIDMLSEDLYVSFERIRVRYVFRNRAGHDVRLIVGFPLPERDPSTDADGDTAYPSEFRTIADGQPVSTQVEYRAFVNGTDHTELLNRLGVPIDFGEPEDFEQVERVLLALSEADRARLVALGLAEPFDDPVTRGHRVWPKWAVRETWHWEQVFPAGRDLVIEHSYRPGGGGTIGTALTPDLRNDAAMADQLGQYRRRYCIDDAFLAGVDRAWTRNPQHMISEDYVSYILTTGAGWRSPIGEFRLVVDKGRPQDLVSFCGEGVRRISPTQFELRRHNWRPTEDLHVLILHPSS